LVLCPGDLGDKADAVAQKIAWEKLEKIRETLGAKVAYWDCRNHDVDSRTSFCRSLIQEFLCKDCSRPFLSIFNAMKLKTMSIRIVLVEKFRFSSV
jgi:hypothetical protein